jgi:methionine-gamma-lyase
MAAISSVYMALCSSGDRVVTARQLYGGTHSLFSDLLPRYGIEAAFFDVDDFAGIEQALAGAKALHCETIGNPAVRVANIPRLAELARAAGVPLVVDNTFASPILCRPLTLGASIVVHSATKSIGGHSDLMGGVICVDDPSLLRTIQELTRETGPTLSPFNAWLALRGLSTIHLRVERACDSALKVARFLEQHPEIEDVFYPALDASPDKALCDSMLGGRGGGTLGFDVRGGRSRTSEFQARLQVILRAASLGGTHSLIVHAASVTHTQLDPEQLDAAGISEGFCRLSIGLEDPEDLIADLDQALSSR